MWSFLAISNHHIPLLTINHGSLIGHSPLFSGQPPSCTGRPVKAADPASLALQSARMKTTCRRLLGTHHSPSVTIGVTISPVTIINQYWIQHHDWPIWPLSIIIKYPASVIKQYYITCINQDYPWIYNQTLTLATIIKYMYYHHKSTTFKLRLAHDFPHASGQGHCHSIRDSFVEIISSQPPLGLQSQLIFWPQQRSISWQVQASSAKTRGCLLNGIPTMRASLV